MSNSESESKSEATTETQAVLEQILEVSRRFYDKGLVEGTAGNVSARIDDGLVAITPSSMAYHEMGADDLVCVNLDGEVVRGERNPSAETSMHLACYRSFPEVKAVMHSHPLYASMFAVARQPIPAAIEEVTIYIGGDIPVCDYAMTGTPELGEAVAAKLADRSAALLANHGLICVGKSPHDVLHSALVVERTAQIVWGSRALGEQHFLPEKVNRDFGEVYGFIRKEMWG